MRKTLFFAALVVFTAASGPQVMAADVEEGRRLAELYCERCHDISAEGAFKTYPPSFASIAAFRPEDQLYARVIFPAMHSGMPDTAFYTLDRSQIDDLIAYIVSVERK